MMRHAVLLLAIAATLAVTSAAASPAHFHNSDLAGGCDVCSIAHLPVVQPPVAASLFPPALSDWGLLAPDPCATEKRFHQTAFSRGPPAHLK